MKLYHKNDIQKDKKDQKRRSVNLRSSFRTISSEDIVVIFFKIIHTLNTSSLIITKSNVTFIMFWRVI